MKYDKSIASSQFTTSTGADRRRRLDPLDANDKAVLKDHYDNHSKHTLAPEVINHLYLSPLASIYGAHGRPYNPSTIKEAFDIFVHEAVDIEYEKPVYQRMFKGVNKKLSFPLIACTLNAYISEFEKKPTTQTSPVAFGIDPERVIAFSPKNLIKHFGYPEADAKALHRGINGIYHNLPLKLLICDSPNEILQNAHLTSFGKTVVNWKLPANLTRSRLDDTLTKDDMDNIIKLADLDLPCKNLNVWKAIAKGWYERTQDGNFDELSVPRQRRHIVNTIRHNCIYTAIYNEVEYDLIKTVHDITFDKITRKIIHEFPSLSNEARELLNELHDGKRTAK